MRQVAAESADASPSAPDSMPSHADKSQSISAIFHTITYGISTTSSSVWVCHTSWKTQDLPITWSCELMWFPTSTARPSALQQTTTAVDDMHTQSQASCVSLASSKPIVPLPITAEANATLRLGMPLPLMQHLKLGCQANAPISWICKLRSEE